MDWKDAWEVAGEVLKNDQETIFEMSTRIAQLVEQNVRLLEDLEGAYAENDKLEAENGSYLKALTYIASCLCVNIAEAEDIAYEALGGE